MAKNEHPGAKTVADSRAATEKQNADYYARLDASKPTPTQEENDLARVGALDIDSKELDGSESEVDQERRLMESKLPPATPYANRSLNTSTAPAASDKPAPASPVPAKKV